MIIDCISDLHGFRPTLSGGDLLIVAGDLTARGTIPEFQQFFTWLNEQKYQKKILIAGNHDKFFTSGFPTNQKEFEELQEVRAFLEQTQDPDYYKDDFEYLCDFGIEFEGLKIWGSPWTPTFLDWHFMKDRGGPIKAMWDLIPDDTEILITHGPPLGIQDEVKFPSKANLGKLAGCEELRVAIDQRLKKLKLHVFGHVHEGYGKMIVNGVIHVNASLMDENYNPVNLPIRIEL